MARGRPAESTQSRRTTVRGRAGDRREGRVQSREMSETGGRGAQLAWPGTAKGHARGGRWDRTRTPRGAVTDGLCRVVVRACMEGGTTRREARRGRGGQKKNNKHNPAATQEGEKRRVSARRGNGVEQTGRQDTAGGARKNKKRQKQQRRVTRWGKGTGNGGHGGQEEGTTTGPEESTPPKRKGAGRERTVLVTRTSPRQDADPVGQRQRVSGGPVG